MSDSRLISASLSIFFLLFTGCEKTAVEPDPLKSISVLAFLKSDTTRQNIYVYKAAKLEDEDLPGIDEYFCRSANVTLYNSDGNSFPCNLATRLGRKCFVNTSRLNFLPGSKYKLVVKTQGETITCETTFPEDFQITAPLNEEIFYWKENQDGYSVCEINTQWTKSENAYAYLVNAYIPRISVHLPDTNYQISEYSYLAKETNCKLVIYSVYPAYDSTKSTQITITAVDKNFYQHYFEQYNSSGVEGGYGFMGSGTVKSIKVKIIQPPGFKQAFNKNRMQP